MTRDSGLAREQNPVADAAAARDARLSTEDASLADLRVVTDLHQVVDLRAAAHQVGAQLSVSGVMSFGTRSAPAPEDRA